MMASQPRDELARQYNDLTPKQTAVVDAHAQNPSETNRKKSNIAAQLLKERVEAGDVPRSKAENQDGVIDVNESYCSQTLKSKYPEVANYREEIVQNERSEGEMTTEGDPFSAIPDDSGGFQTIKDRPVKNTQTQTQTETSDTESGDQPANAPTAPRKAVQIKQEDDGLLVWFDERYLRELLESQELPPQLHQRLVDAVLAQAFN